MLNTIKIGLLACILGLTSACKSNINEQTNKEQPITKNILVFSKTNGYRHKSIESGISTLKELGIQNKWNVQFSEDSLVFNTDKLSKNNLVIFLNTTGDILGSKEEKVFESYINQGGAFLGIHSATDTEYNWEFYQHMIAAQFASHPKQQTARVLKSQTIEHPATNHYSSEFEKHDEWYNFKEPVEAHANILLTLDESSYSGKQMHAEHPISWYHHYEGGRVFYTGMGHTNASYQDPNFLTHLKNGIVWCLGESEVEIKQGSENLLDTKLSKWDVFMGGVHTSVDIDFEKSDDVRTSKSLGLNNDVKDVFSVIKENNEDVLHITGEIYGGLTTKNEYQNYHFETEFKWGTKKWEPRLKDKRDSGILYHAKGVHGAFWNVWMASLEFQVQEGDCGDFIALGDVYGDVPSTGKLNNNGKKHFIYNPKGDLIPLKWGTGFESGQASKSELFENKNGEWNKLEIYVLGNESIHLVNGHVVNRVKNARYDISGKTIPVTKGKIQIQSEAAEIFYKNMKITAIESFPKELKNK